MIKKLFSFDNCKTSAEYIRKCLPSVPETAVILGSAISGFADAISPSVVIPYADIPHYPLTTVSYQPGKLLFGSLGNHSVLALNGRFHYYEGYELWQTAYPIFVMKLLGVKRLIITNAAGGIDSSYKVGDLVLIRDHIKLFSDSPLRGAEIPELGDDRFFDMQNAYSDELAQLALKTADKLGIPLKEGVYAFMGGPQYETPAEIRMLKLLGATLVGMSTVPEVIAAARCSLPVLGISCVSNMAAGIDGAPISGHSVTEAGLAASPRFTELVKAIIEESAQ